MGSESLYENTAAEKEADDIGNKFMNSSDVLGDMGKAYGRDLKSEIRIHDDSASDRRVRSANREALTVGRDIFFGKGALDGSKESKQTLGHEVAHVIQQTGSGQTRQTAPFMAAQGKKTNLEFIHYDPYDVDNAPLEDLSAASKDPISRFTSVPTYNAKGGGVKNFFSRLPIIGSLMGLFGKKGRGKVAKRDPIWRLPLSALRVGWGGIKAALGAVASIPLGMAAAISGKKNGRARRWFQNAGAFAGSGLGDMVSGLGLGSRWANRVGAWIKAKTKPNHTKDRGDDEFRSLGGGDIFIEPPKKSYPYEDEEIF